MANTVRSAFNIFMKDIVNLDNEKTKLARNSRDNLVSNIRNFKDSKEFFNLYNDIDIFFGSFARKTKIRPLDDIDIMIGLSGDGSTYYEENTDDIKIYVNNEESRLYSYCNSNTKILNSTKVINKFIKELKCINNYRHAEMHKNGSAATLQLKSYDWNFDIVPCFITSEDIEGKTYYIIPNGEGNWLKTDPRVDRDYVKKLNKKHDGEILNAIRLLKYWNKRPTMPSMQSYLLESLLLKYFDEEKSIGESIEIIFKDILFYIKENIFYDIYDPKKIQGNLNNLTFEEKYKIREKAYKDYEIAVEAIELEKTSHKKAIDKWIEILGCDFPEYGS